MEYVKTKEIRDAVKGHELSVLGALNIPWGGKNKKHIRCPYPDHNDANPSWRWDASKARAFCTCCTASIFDVVAKIRNCDFEAAKLFVADAIGRSDLKKEKSDRPRPPGYTLQEYSAAKKLPLDFLFSLGLRETTYRGARAVAIPYFDVVVGGGTMKYRVAAKGPDNFAWKSGSKRRLYGLNRIPAIREAGWVVIVEGESDSHTLWFHDFPALGLPGADTWNEYRDVPLLADVPAIYVTIEPDKGGEAMLKWLGRSAIGPRAKLVRLPVKDPSALYLSLDPDGINPSEEFKIAFKQALDTAEPFEEIRRRTQAIEAERARADAGDLLDCDDILDRFGKAVESDAIGLVGETRNAKILYLAFTSRLLTRPVSVCVKGVSSGGKSYTVESTSRFFPPGCYWERTAMSGRVLAYSGEDFRHRHLVIYEAAAFGSRNDDDKIFEYLLRSLLSENRIQYEVVEKDPLTGQMGTRTIEKEGPTGLIVTTTGRLHPENETRVLSLTVKDDKEQTRRVLRQLAKSDAIGKFDYSKWHAFQQSLALGERRVTVPFAPALANLVEGLTVRMRRDFGMLLSLIRSHALLRREFRQRDAEGRIVAQIGDYKVVRELVADQFAASAEASVPKTVRETVNAVAELTDGDKDNEVSQAAICKKLNLDKRPVSNRIHNAVNLGYLVNREDRRGRPARIALGDPMPGDVDVLPSMQAVLQRCTSPAGNEAPASSSENNEGSDFVDEREEALPPLRQHYNTATVRDGQDNSLKSREANERSKAKSAVASVFDELQLQHSDTHRNTENMHHDTDGRHSLPADAPKPGDVFIFDPPTAGASATDKSNTEIPISETLQRSLQHALQHPSGSPQPGEDHPITVTAYWCAECGRQEGDMATVRWNGAAYRLHADCRDAWLQKHAVPPATKASVPFMITRQMKRRLANLGYSTEEISVMTPTDARRIIGDDNAQLCTGTL